MHTTGLAVLKLIKPDIIETIYEDGREDDDHGLELDGVDLEIITLADIKLLKVRQSPVIAIFNEHHEIGLHYISPHDKLLSAFDTTLDDQPMATRYHSIGGGRAGFIQTTHEGFPSWESFTFLI